MNLTSLLGGDFSPLHSALPTHARHLFTQNGSAFPVTPAAFAMATPMEGPLLSASAAAFAAANAAGYSAPVLLASGSSAAHPDTLGDQLNMLQTLLIIVVSSVLSLVTIVGNVLVMISLKMDRQLRTISNYFLLSLSLADFLIGLISMPLYTMYLLMGRWPLGPFICDCWLAFDYLNSNASVLNLLLISFDRYFSVTRPLTYRVRRTTRRAVAMISLTWVLSALLWPPWIFLWPYIEGQRTVPPDDCYIQFLQSNAYITFGTAIGEFGLGWPEQRRFLQVEFFRCALRMHFQCVLHWHWPQLIDNFFRRMASMTGKAPRVDGPSFGRESRVCAVKVDTFSFLWVQLMRPHLLGRSRR